MSTRRNMIKQLFQGAAVVGSGSLLWSSWISESKPDDTTLRPPGAIDTENFVRACIKCGKCVEACPYKTLKLGEIMDNKGIGLPYFIPREIPCYMCTDFPCTSACPTGALKTDRLSKGDLEPDINNARIGLAVIHQESCIAYWGIQCDACYRACPLIGSAIILQTDKNMHTKKHANLKPLVNSDVCTGCGMCEHACVVEKSAIHVLPLSIALGKVGSHYIKSWDKNDEIRLEKAEKQDKYEDKDLESSLEYLNNDDTWINE